MRLSHLILASSLLLAPLAARADDYFTVSYGGDVIHYTLPASPTPDYYSPDAFFGFNIVPALQNGSPVDDSVAFFTSDVGGGLLDIALLIAPFGGQYFTGDVSAPTFVPGTYDFVGGGSVSISTTPEPSSLVLLGTGALGMAGAVRRRLRK